MGIVVPGASWHEIFRGNHQERNKEAENKKGDISNEVMKGTFLKSFDRRAWVAVVRVLVDSK